MRLFLVGAVAACVTVLFVGAVSASTPGADVKVTRDGSDPGYVSAYTIATGQPYADATLEECSRSRGRQNEPAIAVDPRDTHVILGSSNDYCGVYNRGIEAGAVGPIWLGYYRSENGGRRFLNSLVPGYPDDQSPYRALSQARTASAGDPVIAWDAEGRAFFGSESSDDPAGTAKTFGDVFVARYENSGGGTINDGKRYRGTTIVARGSSAPNLLGKFNDKTAIEADHNSDNRCDNNVYFAYSRFTGNAGGVGIYFSRSTNHGVSFSHPVKVSQTISDVQFPDIAVTGNDNVYVVFRSFASGRGPEGNSIYYVKSTDCGATFSRPKLLQNFVPNDAQDESSPEAAPRQARPDDPASGDKDAAEAGTARDCGDFADACTSGYTFFRRDTQPRATADQFDTTNPDRFYVVYDASRGPIVPTGSTYGTNGPGKGSQAAIYFLRVNGATGGKFGPNVIDAESVGHQVFPDISADNPDQVNSAGTLHAIWWDSRLDVTCYSITRPIGNCADRRTVPSLDSWGAVSDDYGMTWSSSRVSNFTSNPNYEQFDNRSVPFAGDYLYVSSVNDFSYGVWTDWRDTVKGTDPREAPEDEDATTADVLQCRTQDASGAWSGDQCPRNGGIDQNIYGDFTP